MKKLLTLSIAMGLSAAVWAKLPPLSDEAKAKAAETADKAAWSGKVDSYKLCVAQDKVAARYVPSVTTGTKPVAAPAAKMPPCIDPGPFLAAVVPAPMPVASSAKPMEAAGAHSPTATAAAPPVGAPPDAATTLAVKKP